MWVIWKNTLKFQANTTHLLGTASPLALSAFTIRLFRTPSPLWFMDIFNSQLVALSHLYTKQAHVGLWSLWDSGVL